MSKRFTAKLRAVALGALVISAIGIAGCGSSGGSSSSAAAAPAASSSTSSSTSSSSAAAGASAGSIATAKGSAGTYLTGAGGRAVYLWVADKGGKSVCYGACAKAWPPVEANGKPSVGSGVDASLLGTVKRKDGSEQVTYKGQPLYYFIADRSAGQTTGQSNDSFGAKWWLVAPSGAAITSG